MAKTTFDALLSTLKMRISAKIRQILSAEDELKKTTNI